MSDHYFADSPSTPSEPTDVVLTLPGVQFTLRTDRGVFARDEVDVGTRLLLTDAPTPARAPTLILDLGCGYGPIACALAHRYPEAAVWAIDTNERARQLCRDNAAGNGLGNVNVAAPAEMDPSLTFDLIWSNPPIRIGKAALHDLLRQWLSRLAPGGEAVLVVQKHLGSDSLQRWLTEQGWPTERVASRRSFRLLRIEPAP